jgi:DNA-binding NtrC family response regulator
VAPPPPARAAASPAPASLRLDEVERRHIEHVLHLTGGNKRRAARLLGLSRSTLDRKLATMAMPALGDMVASDAPAPPPS